MTFIAPGTNQKPWLSFLRHRRWIRNKGANVFVYEPGASIATLGGTLTRASSATYVDSNGIVQTVGNDVLRDANYLFGFRTTLTEEQRTNLCLRSQEFDNAAWGATRASVTANAATAPDGTVTADKLVEDATAGATHQINPTANFVVVNGSVYTNTVFVKASTRNWIALAEGIGTTASAYFNLATGAIGTVSGTGAPVASILALGNGWYRCRLSFTAIGVAARIAVLLANGDNGAVYNGDGVSGLFLWGASCELGIFPTSYIATVAAAVTRSPDALIFNIPAALGATPRDLTLYLKYFDLGSFLDVTGPVQAQLSAAGANPRLFYNAINGNGYNGQFVNGAGAGGSSQPFPTPGLAPLVLQEGIVTISLTGGVDMKVSINGAPPVDGGIGGDPTALTGAWTKFSLGCAGNGVRQACQAVVSAKLALAVKTISQMESPL